MTNHTIKTILLKALLHFFIYCKLSNSFITHKNTPPTSSFKLSPPPILTTLSIKTNNYESYPSTFPKEIPSGIRGEAVRSSLRSKTRGIWYKPLVDLNSCMIHIHGKGTLNFLNNKFSNTFKSFPISKESCVLTQKGQVFDKVIVSVDGEEDAYIITSPYSGDSLFNTLKDLIFPLDEVGITDVTSSASIFVIASTTYKNTQDIITNLFTSSSLSIKAFPKSGEASKQDTITILSDIGFPRCAMQGYLIYTFDPSTANAIQTALLHEEDDTIDIPMLLKKREYESLRIEAGIPSHGNEITSHIQTQTASAAPLELLLQHTIDTEKGCYLGQEQVSAMLKNKLGPPRTLYQIIFHDDMNDRLVKQPEPNDVLYVLGSNQTIKVGFITSVAEPGGTGRPCTIALALISRSKSILDKMKQMDLEIEYKEQKYDSKYPLHGLDVIINNTFTIGTLQTVPFLRFPLGTNMFDPSIQPQEEVDDDTIVDVVGSGEEEDIEAAIQKAKEEEAAAKAEAKRKAEKLELLQKRAEAAILARKKKKM